MLMKVAKDRVYDFLNQFIDSKLMPSSVVVSEAFAKNKPVYISGNRFTLNCWKEASDKGDIVCVQVSRKKMFFLSEAYSLGVLLSGEAKEKLGQEELWNMGF